MELEKMPLPSVEQFIGTNVTEQGFKNAQKQFVEYVGNEVPKKIDTYTKAEVDNVFAAYVGGRKGYTTLALAQADQANLTANTVVEVTNDGANNGIYQWDGTTLTKSAYDPLNQSKSYTDDSISDLFTIGVNLFNKNKTIPNSYYAYTTGELSSTTGYVSYFCEVKPNTEYRVPSSYGQQIAFYGADKAYVSGLATVATDGLFTTPSNAFYVGLSVDVDIVDIMMLCESSLYPNEYVPYLVNLKDSFVDLDQVKGLKENLNILNALYVKDKYVLNTTGEFGYVTGFYLVGEVKVKPSTRYKTSSNYDQQFAFYDENGTYISGMPHPPVDFTFVTPPNAHYAYFTLGEAIFGSVIIAEYQFFDKAVLEHQYMLQESIFVRSSQVGGLAENIEGVTVSRLGLRPLNILDPAKFADNSYVIYTDGSVGYNPDYYAARFYEVKPNTEYQTSQNYFQQFAFYDANYGYISGLPNPPANRKFTTPSNAKYIGFSIPKSQANEIVIAESSIFPTSYVASDVYLSEKIMTSSDMGVKNTDIWVSADTSDTSVAFTGKNAIQLAINSITDASPTNRYTIRVKKGLYKVDKASDFIGYIGYPAMVEMKDYVDVVGQGEDNTIVWAELPYDDADIGLSVNGGNYPRNQYQTIYNFAKEATVKDLTFVAKNLRYTLHQDDPRGANTSRYYKNVGMIFKGNIGSLTTMGTGTHTGEETYLEGGRAVSDVSLAFAVHNNTAFDKPSVWSFKSYAFNSVSGNAAILLQSDGSLLQDKLELIGCSFGGAAYKILYADSWLIGDTATNKDSFNHAEWHIFGHGNDPFLFENLIGSGNCLRFKSNDIGVGVTIRIDKTSTAYPILIENNQNNVDASLYVDSREYIDGYIVQDGSVGLPAQAWGCKDLSEVAYLYDNGINYTSLRTRLGNLSADPKTLRVTVNGVLNTITFDKDYSSMSNAQILSEINTQLSNVTVDLYVYGRDYYPTITDVCETVYNTGDSYIPKGKLVAKAGGTVRIANGNDKVYGVALDDIPVMQITSEGVRKGQGRVLKRGYISANQGNVHFVLADNQSPNVGTKFSVSNGQLVTDANGKISVDIDNSIVSINC